MSPQRAAQAERLPDRSDGVRRDISISGSAARYSGIMARRPRVEYPGHSPPSRAVILCTRGFEHNRRLQSHYLQIRNTIPMSPLGNTGDGILMAQKAGAALWHMWHLHGGYGFHLQATMLNVSLAERLREKTLLQKSRGVSGPFLSDLYSLSQ